MQEFDFEAPTSLAEAIEQLAGGGRSRPLAGGTDLIDQLRTDRLVADRVVDVKRIAELNVFELDDRGLRLGAAVPCYRIYERPEMVERYAALVDSCRIIGGIQIQSRASVGGNLCNSSPAADTTPSVIVLGGTCVIQGPGGRREVAAEQFCTGPGKNMLAAGELLVEIRFPPRPRNSGSHYRRFTPRNEMDIAVVGVGASVELDDSLDRIVSARVALGGVAPTPLLVPQAAEALAGQPVGDAALAAAAEAARQATRPITDMRGTREYRIHLTGVLTQRVLHAAILRARGQTLDYQPGH